MGDPTNWMSWSCLTGLTAWMSGWVSELLVCFRLGLVLAQIPELLHFGQMDIGRPHQLLASWSGWGFYCLLSSFRPSVLYANACTGCSTVNIQNSSLVSCIINIDNLGLVSCMVRRVCSTVNKHNSHLVSCIIH